MTADGAFPSEPRVYRLALERQHGEHALMNATQRFTRNEPLQCFMPKHEFP